MFELLNLEELGTRLQKVDRQIVALLGKRMELSLQVGEYKRTRHQAISRPDIEKWRLDGVGTWAQGHGMNPEFIRSIFYSIIGESCKMQMIQLQDSQNSTDDPEAQNEDDWRTQLKKNLLRLTERCASTYDELYAAGFYATRLHAEFEESMILKICKQERSERIALDLGCATGHIAFMIRDHFKEVVGYDISPAMIAAARNRYSRQDGKISFEVADIEEGVPQPDGTASLIVLSMGFASDLFLLPKVLREVHRVLVPGGIAFFSFYNSDALLYRWEFIPWPAGLAAEINLRKHCLDVHWGENEIYSIYARAYRVEEVEDIMPRGLAITQITTHPSICSILPDTVLSDERVRNSIAQIDKDLIHENTGAYITVIARKS